MKVNHVAVSSQGAAALARDVVARVRTELSFAHRIKDRALIQTLEQRLVIAQKQSVTAACLALAR